MGILAATTPGSVNFLNPLSPRDDSENLPHLLVVTFFQAPPDFKERSRESIIFLFCHYFALTSTVFRNYVSLLFFNVGIMSRLLLFAGH